MLTLHILVFIGGLFIIVVAVRSAVRTLVLSRSARDPVTGVVFRGMRALFDIRLRWADSYYERDRIMAYYAPLSLMAVLPTWMALVLVGFGALFWATGVPSWTAAMTISGSSLLTLGYATGTGPVHNALEIAEAALGLILVALLIAYLPTMYSAFSRREAAVTLLEVRAGKPPSAVEMLMRYYRNDGLDSLRESWRTWETWFADIDESHTSLAALVFFRSPQPDHSWVTAAGTVLDAASLTLSTLDVPWDAQAALCIRSGYLSLRRIADFFEVAHDPDPHFPETPISVTREEFEAAYDRLAEAGLPLKGERAKAWLDFAGWRVNYDAVLLALCRLTLAPMAPWSSDRA
ncbi:MAG: hypothetical protein ACWGPS_03230 [Candidatus Promineifilaceae bacterium]